MIETIKHYSKIKSESFGKPLKNGEKRVIVLPAYSIRKDPDTGSDYGHKPLEFIFALRRGSTIATWAFLSGMYLYDTSLSRAIGENIQIHSLEEIESDIHRDDCLLTGGNCWMQSGSYLYGDRVMERLMSEGTDGIWDELEKAIKPIKQAQYKAKMIEKYGEDVFVKRASKMTEAANKKGGEWKSKQATKAAKKRWEDK